jgi:hypothetical protein
VPFTPAHGAAILPFLRFGLVPSALLVGAFAPDYEYFIRLGPNGRYGHTFPGVFLLTLPLALVVLWLFHSFVKAPAVRLLPEGIQRRLGDEIREFRFGGAGTFALIVCSLLLGIATHLLWDAFTHPNTWPYRHWPALRQSLPLPMLGPVPYYKLLQHGSTIAGLGIFAAWIVLWYRRSEPSSRVVVATPKRMTVIIGGLAIAVAGGALRAGLVMGIPSTLWDARWFIIRFGITVMALLWWQLVAYGIFSSVHDESTTKPSRFLYRGD